GSETRAFMRPPLPPSYGPHGSSSIRLFDDDLSTASIISRDGDPPPGSAGGRPRLRLLHGGRPQAPPEPARAVGPGEGARGGAGRHALSAGRPRRGPAVGVPRPAAAGARHARRRGRAGGVREGDPGGPGR